MPLLSHRVFPSWWQTGNPCACAVPVLCLFCFMVSLPATVLAQSGEKSAGPMVQTEDYRVEVRLSGPWRETETIRISGDKVVLLYQLTDGVHERVMRIENDPVARQWAWVRRSLYAAVKNNSGGGDAPVDFRSYDCVTWRVSIEDGLVHRSCSGVAILNNALASNPRLSPTDVPSLPALLGLVDSMLKEGGAG